MVLLLAGEWITCPNKGLALKTSVSQSPLSPFFVVHLQRWLCVNSAGKSRQKKETEAKQQQQQQIK